MSSTSGSLIWHNHLHESFLGCQIGCHLIDEVPSIINISSLILNIQDHKKSNNNEKQVVEYVHINDNLGNKNVVICIILYPNMTLVNVQPMVSLIADR